MQINNFWNTYKGNIIKTHKHKIAYAIDEYRQFGYNSVDSITHDADKMFMYLLGMSHDKVVKVHRSISEHHIENDIPKNLKSMFIDIHCSGVKPDKPIPFKDYFYSNKELQEVPGLEKFSKDRNFGQNISMGSLKKDVDNVTSSFGNFFKFGLSTLGRIIKNINLY